MASVMDSLVAFRKKLTRATGDALGEVKALREAIRAKRLELRDVARAALPLSEVEQRVKGLVQTLGDRWIAAHGSSLIRPQEVRDGRPFGAMSLAGPGHGRQVELPWSGDAMPFGAMAAADPEQAASLLVSLVRRLGYQAGLPLADRAALLSRLQAELHAIESTEEQAVDEAVAAGLALGHRDEVRQRREAAARKVELDAEAVANRQARQRKVDDDHAQRTRTVVLDPEGSGGRSAYLASGGAARP